MPNRTHFPIPPPNPPLPLEQMSAPPSSPIFVLLTTQSTSSASSSCSSYSQVHCFLLHHLQSRSLPSSQLVFRLNTHTNRHNVSKKLLPLFLDVGLNLLRIFFVTVNRKNGKFDFKLYRKILNM